MPVFTTELVRGGGTTMGMIVPDEALAERHKKFGIPAEFAAMLARMDGMIAGGAEARTTATVAELTGHEPTSFATFVEERTSLWRD